MANTFSTNTTVTVQVPEGCQLPTTGGITSVDYSTQNVPYGFPRDKSRWDVGLLVLSNLNTSGTTTNTVYNPAGMNLNTPIGSWKLSYSYEISITPTANYANGWVSLSTSASAFTIPQLSVRFVQQETATSNAQFFSITKEMSIRNSTATKYYILLNHANPFSIFTVFGNTNANNYESTYVIAENNYL